MLPHRKIVLQYCRGWATVWPCRSSRPLTTSEGPVPPSPSPPVFSVKKDSRAVGPSSFDNLSNPRRCSRSESTPSLHYSTTGSSVEANEQAVSSDPDIASSANRTTVSSSITSPRSSGGTCSTKRGCQHCKSDTCSCRAFKTGEDFAAFKSVLRRALRLTAWFDARPGTCVLLSCAFRRSNETSSPLYEEFIRDSFRTWTYATPLGLKTWPILSQRVITGIRNTLALANRVDGCPPSNQLQDAKSPEYFSSTKIREKPQMQDPYSALLLSTSHRGSKDGLCTSYNNSKVSVSSGDVLGALFCGIRHLTRIQATFLPLEKPTSLSITEGNQILSAATGAYDSDATSDNCHRRAVPARVAEDRGAQSVANKLPATTHSSAGARATAVLPPVVSTEPGTQTDNQDQVLGQLHRGGMLPVINPANCPLKPGMLLAAHPLCQHIWKESVILLTRVSSDSTSVVEGVILNKRPANSRRCSSTGPLEARAPGVSSRNNACASIRSEFVDILQSLFHSEESKSQRMPNLKLRSMSDIRGVAQCDLKWPWGSMGTPRLDDWNIWKEDAPHLRQWFVRNRRALLAYCRNRGWYGGPVRDITVLRRGQATDSRSVVVPTVISVGFKEKNTCTDFTSTPGKAETTGHLRLTASLVSNEGLHSGVRLVHRTAPERIHGTLAVSRRRSRGRRVVTESNTFGDGQCEALVLPQPSAAGTSDGCSDAARVSETSAFEPRLYVGVACWEASQLKSEILSGFWLPFYCTDPKALEQIVWNDGGTEMWKKCLSSLAPSLLLAANLPTTALSGVISNVTYTNRVPVTRLFFGELVLPVSDQPGNDERSGGFGNTAAASSLAAALKDHPVGGAADKFVTRNGGRRFGFFGPGSTVAVHGVGEGAYGEDDEVNSVDDLEGDEDDEDDIIGNHSTGDDLSEDEGDDDDDDDDDSSDDGGDQHGDNNDLCDDETNPATGGRDDAHNPEHLLHPGWERLPLIPQLRAS